MVGSESVCDNTDPMPISSSSINTVGTGTSSRNCHPVVQKALLHQTVAQMKALGLDTGITAESAGALGASIARSDIPFK